MDSSTRDMIPLCDWITIALKSINTHDQSNLAFGTDPQALALRSDAFLSSALEVARSLADQICRAQEVAVHGHAQPKNNEEDRPNNGAPRHYLPSPASDWADNVVIHLSSSSNEHEFNGDHRDLQPLPFCPDKNPSATPQELRDMLNSVIGNVSLLEKEDDEDHEVPTNNDPNYLSVASATLMPPSNKDSHNGDGVRQIEGGEMQRIYSMGLLFYEIFSGGERPVRSEPPTAQMSDDASHVMKFEPDEANEDLHSLHDPNEPLDVAKNLNILDENGDDDSIFGTLNGSKRDIDNSHHEGNTSKNKTIKRSDSKFHAISVESLRSKGLPRSLSNLIANMLDSANGDLCGDETYRHMSDVASDLQRMLEKPHTYLDDIDLAKLSVTGLQLNETVFGREAEFASLQAAYKRSICRKSELAIISGTSGTGKSVLAHRLRSFVTARGEIFLSAKFDQLQQATPFFAIAAAFNQYFDILVNKGDTIRTKKVVAELNRVLGKESFHLSRVIPSLSIVIGQDDSQHFFDDGCVNAQRRLLYLLCQFVEVIASSSGVPVTLFLDDLQWADAASIEVIRQLLLNSGPQNKTKQFFFLGCVREEEVHGNHPFLHMLSSVSQFGIRATTITLSCMNEDMVNTRISDMLCLSPRLTRTLANIVYHKTNGNQLFFSQLMLSLSRDGLLRPSLSRCRWVWDEEKILSRKLPDDVAKFIAGNIGRLPQNVQTSLSVLSCFGATVKVSLVEALESKLQISLTASMEKAVSEGVLDKINGTFSFVHDRLQEAAYNLMKPEDRCLFHFKYGIALVVCNMESNDDGMLLGGPKAVKDAKKYTLIANLNLTAGTKAMEMSDFSTAYSYFDHGISFLRKGHWQNDYDLSLKLFVAAAKCALFNGNIISLKYLSQQVLTFGKSFEDKLEVLYITVSALATVEPPQAVAKAVSVLSSLGEEFSASHSEPHNIKLLLEQTKILLSTYTDETLLKHKAMEDPLKLMAMKFLARLEVLTQMARPSWQPIVTIKMVHLSINYGMGPMSPIGFTFYGMLLTRLGDIHEGCRYVKIGRKLLDRPGAKEVAGQVITVGAEVLCFVEPVRCAIDYHLEAHAAAMSAGDMNNALLSSLCYSVDSYWAGKKLPVVRAMFAKSRSLMEKQGNLVWISHMTPLERTMLSLIGVDERQLPGQPVLGVKIPYSQRITYSQELYASYMFRQYETTSAAADNYFAFTENFISWSLIYSETAMVFHSGLAAYWIFRKSSNAKWVGRASKAKLAIKKWADTNEWNFQNKLYLMEAEEAYCHNDVASAKSFYDKAISSARKHKFINEEALACELAGYFFMEIGQKDIAVNHFLQAHEKYHDWGAIAKANALYESTMSTLNTRGGQS